MHSFLSRCNALFAFTVSVSGAMTFLFFLTTVSQDYHKSVVVRADNIAVKSMADYNLGREKNDLGFLTFDLSADFSSLFNWNAKQLFLYLVAEYSSPANELNQVVLWDKIVLRGENPVFDIKHSYTKYYFWDDGHGLKGNPNVTLSLHWNVIPNAGLMPHIRASGLHSFSFPSQYASRGSAV